MRSFFVLLGVLIISATSFYGFVFGGTMNSGYNISLATTLSKVIVPGDEALSKAYLVYRSATNISDANVYSLCSTQSRFIEKRESIYIFEIMYTDASCKSKSVVLQFENNTLAQSRQQLPLISEDDLFNEYLDTSSPNLERKKRSYALQKSDNAIYKNYSGEQLISFLRYAIGKQRYNEAVYMEDFVNIILTAREKKYLVPVQGRVMPTTPSKIPNAARPYRAAYTDGIHHGWDIDGYIGEELIALDDGVIVYIKDDFSDQSFSDVVYGNTLTYEQKLRNLDVLRGNQVWLKTMKGDIVFYSHLEDVNSDLKVGDRVTRGEILGTMGISGVPGTGYTDYHLHFAIQKNPYTPEKAGEYSLYDYMDWDWYGRGLPQDQVLELSSKIFE